MHTRLPFPNIFSGACCLEFHKFSLAFLFDKLFPKKKKKKCTSVLQMRVLMVCRLCHQYRYISVYRNIRKVCSFNLYQLINKVIWNWFVIKFSIHTSNRCLTTLPLPPPPCPALTRFKSPTALISLSQANRNRPFPLLYCSYKRLIFLLNMTCRQ